MKSLVTILFAGAMFSAVFAAGDDNGAEARFRMKFGRPSPQEEIRLAAARKTAEPVLMASNDCGMHDCCKRSH